MLPREGQVGNSASSKGREEVEVGAVGLLLLPLNPLFSKYHLSRRLGTSRPQEGPPERSEHCGSPPSRSPSAPITDTPTLP